MKSYQRILIYISIVLICCYPAKNYASELWQTTGNLHSYQIDTLALSNLIKSNDFLMELPLPEGGFELYSFTYTPVFSQQLQNKYPEIRTYTGTLNSNKLVSAKLTICHNSINVYIYNNRQSYIIQKKEGGY